MVQGVSIEDIRARGFDWPKYTLVDEHCVVRDGSVDLRATIERMRASHAYYRKQVSDAFRFKMQTGADYADFTERHDDDARLERQLGEAIAYLERIVQALQR